MKKLMFFITVAFLLSLAVSAGEPYKAGDKASDFSLKNVSGKTVSLSDYSDARGFIVVFTCNTCPYAKKYEQRIMKLHEKYNEKGFPVVAINSNDKVVSPGDSYEEMKKLAAGKGYKFDYLYDETQEVAEKYGATNTPHVYVLSRQGNDLRVEYVGAIDNNADDSSRANKHYVDDAVNSLLKGEKVALTATRAVGCSLKWKN